MAERMPEPLQKILIGISRIWTSTKRFVKQKGGKRLTIKKKENYGRKDSLDQLSDDFNRKTAEHFKDILFKIDIINSELRKSLIIKEVD
jgi:hypothetical protein